MDTVLDFIHNFMFSEAAAVGVLKKPELITSVTRLSPTGYCELGAFYLEIWLSLAYWQGRELPKE